MKSSKFNLRGSYQWIISGKFWIGQIFGLRMAIASITLRTLIRRFPFFFLDILLLLRTGLVSNFCEIGASSIQNYSINCYFCKLKYEYGAFLHCRPWQETSLAILPRSGTVNQIQDSQTISIPRSSKNISKQNIGLSRGSFYFIKKSERIENYFILNLNKKCKTDLK